MNECMNRASVFLLKARRFVKDRTRNHTQITEMRFFFSSPLIHTYPLKAYIALYFTHLGTG